MENLSAKKLFAKAMVAGAGLVIGGALAQIALSAVQMAIFFLSRIL
jgi:hypothetical protein